MEHHCACYLLHSELRQNGGNCPSCKDLGKLVLVPDENGKPGAMKSGCPICSCYCSTGPFTDSERPNIARQARRAAKNKNNLDEGPATQASTIAKFGNVLNAAFQIGHSDLRQTNSTCNANSVQATTASNLSNFQFKDDVETHFYRQTLGQPALRFPDGTHPSSYDSRPRGSRFYRNNLANSGSHVLVSPGPVDLTASPGEVAVSIDPSLPPPPNLQLLSPKAVVLLFAPVCASASERVSMHRLQTQRQRTAPSSMTLFLKETTRSRQSLKMEKMRARGLKVCWIMQLKSRRETCSMRNKQASFPGFIAQMSFIHNI
eukprot:scaffold176038_cov34-Attheya_sp.AAC.2